MTSWAELTAPWNNRLLTKPLPYGKLLSAVSGEKPGRVLVHGAETVHDIVVYGGTSAGVVAAVQARKMGKSVVLIEPSHRLGGLTSGGLGQTDIGNKAAIGGLARQFYQAIRAHYSHQAAWMWQRLEELEDELEEAKRPEGVGDKQ